MLWNRHDNHIIVGNDRRMKIFTYRVEAMANRCSQLSLLLTALLFVTTTIISVVSGQPSGEWLIYDGDLV